MKMKYDKLGSLLVEKETNNVEFHSMNMAQRPHTNTVSSECFHS